MSTVTETIKKTKTKTFDGASEWVVLLHNDDYTQMEFVILVLTSIFNHSRENAYNIMMSIHKNGKGVAGKYPFEIAEQKAAETIELARANKFPLNVSIEKV